MKLSHNRLGDFGLSDVVPLPISDTDFASILAKGVQPDVATAVLEQLSMYMHQLRQIHFDEYRNTMTTEDADFLRHLAASEMLLAVAEAATLLPPQRLEAIITTDHLLSHKEVRQVQDYVLNMFDMRLEQFPNIVAGGYCPLSSNPLDNADLEQQETTIAHLLTQFQRDHPDHYSTERLGLLAQTIRDMIRTGHDGR